MDGSLDDIGDFTPESSMESDGDFDLRNIQTVVEDGEVVDDESDDEPDEPVPLLSQGQRHPQEVAAPRLPEVEMHDPFARLEHYMSQSWWEGEVESLEGAERRLRMILEGDHNVWHEQVVVVARGLRAVWCTLTEERWRWELMSWYHLARQSMGMQRRNEILSRLHTYKDFSEFITLMQHEQCCLELMEREARERLVLEIGEVFRGQVEEFVFTAPRQEESERCFAELREEMKREECAIHYHKERAWRAAQLMEESMVLVCEEAARCVTEELQDKTRMELRVAMEVGVVKVQSRDGLREMEGAQRGVVCGEEQLERFVLEALYEQAMTIEEAWGKGVTAATFHNRLLRESEWTCPKCFFKNKGGVTEDQAEGQSCPLCSTPRPLDDELRSIPRRVQVCKCGKELPVGSECSQCWVCMCGNRESTLCCRMCTRLKGCYTWTCSCDAQKVTTESCQNCHQKGVWYCTDCPRILSFDSPECSCGRTLPWQCTECRNENERAVCAKCDYTPSFLWRCKCTLVHPNDTAMCLCGGCPPRDDLLTSDDDVMSDYWSPH